MKKFTKLHRIIHWAIAAVMSVLFITGFLRMYWMSRKTISAAVSEGLAKENLKLPDESLRAIAKSIINPMFDWHINFAYVLVFAYLLRFVYMFVKGVKFPNPFSSSSVGKEKFQGFLYIIFYILLALQIGTGVVLMYELGSEAMMERAEEVHKFAVYWLPTFVLVHFTGIVIAETTDKKRVASKMIGGE